MFPDEHYGCRRAAVALLLSCRDAVVGAASTRRCRAGSGGPSIRQEVARDSFGIVRLRRFGLDSPMDVWIKLRFDIDRLKVARFTKELQYAALDCAIWSFHLIDWVLNAVDWAIYAFGSRRKKSGGRAATQRFMTTNRRSATPCLPFLSSRLPTLESIGS